MALLGDLLVRVGANIDGFEKSMGDVSKRLTAIDREAQRAFSGFDRIGQRLSDIGSSLSLGLTAPLAGLAAASVTAFGTLDSLERGLNTVTGSASKTAAQLADLREVAKLPGLGLQEAVQGSINLQTLGFSADKSKAILLQFGNAIASVGRGKEDLAEVIRQLGQLGARGVVTADNLKPIIERVPQVAKIIKDNFGPEALGNPAETFKKIGVSSEDLINKLIEELGKLPRVTGGIKNDFENLKDTVTVSLGKIGASIAPFVSQAVNVLVPAMEKMVNIFVGLPKPVQDAIIVFAGLAAAMGPILLVSGSLISAVSSIAAAVTAMGGVLTGSMGVAALGAIANAAILAASAFAAFKIGEWAYKNIPGISALGDAIGWLILKIPGVERLVNAIGGVGSVVKPVKDLETQVRATEDALRKQGIAVEQGGLTLTQYASKLAELKKAHGDYAVVVDDSAAKAKASSKAYEALKAELETQEKVLTQLKKAYDMGAASADQLAAQEEKIYKIMRQLHPEWEATRKYSTELMQSLEGSRDAFRELGESAFKSQFQIKTWAETLGITNDQIDIFARSYPQLSQAIQKDSEKLTASIKDSFSSIGDVADIVRESQKQILGDMRELSSEVAKEDPFAKLGIQSQESLRNLAAKARGAYDQIKSNTRSTTLDIQRAWVKMIEAQIAAGEALPRETLNQYEKIKAATGDAIKAVDGAWKQMTRQISTIVTDLSRGIADAIVNFNSLGDVAMSVVKNIATAILRTLIEGAIRQLANELAGLPGIIGSIGKAFGGVAEQAKSATDAVGTLGKVITGAGGVLGTGVGSIPGLPTGGKGTGGIPGMPNGGIDDFPKIPGPGGAGGAGSAISSAAGAGLSGIVGAVAGVVSAISDVISNFQLARQEGTLNAIEQHTKVTAIAIAGISAPWETVAEEQDTMFKKLGDIRNLLFDIKAYGFEFVVPLLSDMKDSIAALAAGSLAFLAASADSNTAAQGAAVAIAQSILESAKTNNAGVQAQLIAVKEAVVQNAVSISGAIASQTSQLKIEFATLAENIYKSINPLGLVGSILGAIGGGLGSLGGAIGEGIGNAGSSLAGGLGAAIGSAASGLGTREEGTLNAIEQHTKVLAVGLVGISAPWEKVATGQDTIFDKLGQIRNALVEKLPWVVDFTHQTASALKDFIQPNVAFMTASLRAIEQQLVATPQVQAAASTNQSVAQSITINVNGSTDPAATAKAVMDLLKTQSPVFV